MDHGWQDPNHEWKYIGKFVVPDIIHKMEIPFGLYCCSKCDSYKTGKTKLDEEYYITPKCGGEDETV